jgi:hypothetical protein
METGQGDNVRCVSYQIEAEQVQHLNLFRGIDCYRDTAIDPKTTPTEIQSDLKERLLGHST